MLAGTSVIRVLFRIFRHSKRIRETYTMQSHASAIAPECNLIRVRAHPECRPTTWRNRSSPLAATTPRSEYIPNLDLRLRRGAGASTRVIAVTLSVATVLVGTVVSL